MSDSPNAKIDSAIKKLLADCDKEIPIEKESGIKVKVDVLKAAMAWEKLKHGIRDKEDEGTNWNSDGGENGQ